VVEDPEAGTGARFVVRLPAQVSAPTAVAQPVM